MYEIQSVCLDIASVYADIYLDATQFDTSRVFQIEFVKDGGRYNINGMQNYFYVKLSTGVTLDTHCYIKSNYLYIEFPQEFTIDSGKVEYEMIVGNNKILGTIFITKFLVDYSPLAVGIEDSSEAAILAESYAHGNTGVREGEDTDNGMYYYNLIKQDTFGICYVKDIGFANLENVIEHKHYMYKILNEFTSTADFVDGGGVRYPAGAHVFYTEDGKWNCFCGDGVVGVRGDVEDEYRHGMINLTKYDFGLPYGVNERFQSAIPSDGTEYWYQPY